jgi:hypothetical protein
MPSHRSSDVHRVNPFVRIGGRTLPHGEERTLTGGVGMMRRIIPFAVGALAATAILLPLYAEGQPERSTAASRQMSS